MNDLLSKVLCVAAGGALGAVGRFFVGYFAVRHFSAVFPWATLIVNVVGCFLAGFLTRTIVHAFAGHELYWLFIVVGFLGGFTTFSAFSVDLLNMLHKGQYFLFVSNVAAHLAGCLIAVIAGYHVSKTLWP